MSPGSSAGEPVAKIAQLEWALPKQRAEPQSAVASLTESVAGAPSVETLLAANGTTAITSPHGQVIRIRQRRPARCGLPVLVICMVAMFLLGVALAIGLVHLLRSRIAQEASTSLQQDTQPNTQAKPKETRSKPVSSKPVDSNEPAMPDLPASLPTRLLDASIPTGKVFSLSIAPFGRQVATLEEAEGKLGQVNIYQFQDSKIVASFPVPVDRNPLGLIWCGERELAVVFAGGVEIYEPLRKISLRQARFETVGTLNVARLLAVAYSPFAEKLAFVCNNTVVVVDTVTMRYRPIKGQIDEVLGIAFRERTGSCLVLTREAVLVVEEKIRRVELPKPEPQAEALPIGAISADGRWLALVWRLPEAASPRYRILVWSLDGAERTLISTPAAPKKLAFLPRASHLAVLYAGQTTVLYQLPRGEIELVQRSEQKGDDLVCAAWSRRAALAGKKELWLCQLLPDTPTPPPPAVDIVTDPTDPPGNPIALFPCPDVAEAKPWREKLRHRYAEAYRQLPASRQDLTRKLLEHGRASDTAAEVLACGLEMAAINGLAADLNGSQIGIAFLQERLLAYPEEMLQLFALQEFTRAYLQRQTLTGLDKVLAQWEQLAESFLQRLELEQSLECWQYAEQLASRDPRLAGQKLAELRWLVERCKRLLADRDSLAAARKAIQRNPNSPESHRLLGTLFAQQLGCYRLAFEHLARCGDDQLEKAAQLELANPKTVEEMLKLADAWFHVGQSVADDKSARWYYERAVLWYQQAHHQQLRENALLAPAIAARWKKAVARFPDLPGPSGTLAVHEVGKWLQPNSVVGPILAKGRLVVCAGREVKSGVPTVLALQLDTGKSQTWKLSEPVQWLAGHPTQSLIAVGLTGGNIFWLDVGTAQSAPQTIQASDVRRGAIAIHAGRLLILCGQEISSYPLGLPAAVQRQKIQWQFGTFAPQLVVNPDGRRLAVVGRSQNGKPRVFYLDHTGSQLDLFEYPEKSKELPLITFNGDATWLAVATEKELRLFSVQPGKLVPEGVIALPNRATAISAHPHKLQFLVGLEEGIVGLVDVNSRQVVPVAGASKAAVRSLVTDPERNQILVLYADGNLAVMALIGAP